MTNAAPPYWMRQTLADLERHEGFRQYAYPDPLSKLYLRHKKEKWGYQPAEIILARIGETPNEGGPWTVGIGFTKGVTFKTRMSREFAIKQLESVVLDHLWVLDKAVPEWKTMPDVVKSVLANLAFNLGNRLFQFKNTIKLLNQGKFAAAGDNLKASLWAKQVKGRATELINRLKTGKVAPSHLVK